jgi:glutathione S-transferase
MKLYCTVASPWVRRVRIAILELGIEDKFEFIFTKWPHNYATQTIAYDPGFLAATPVARIPALVTDDGLKLAESFPILDYLNAEFGNYRLLAASGPARWKALADLSILHGAVESQNIRRAELLRPDGELSRNFARKMRDRLERCYRAINERVEGWGPEVDMVQITAGAMCGYSDFRYPSEDWRALAPALAAWYEPFSQRPSMQATMPRETPQH